MFDIRTTLRIAAPTQRDEVDVRWALGFDERLGMTLTGPMVARLKALPAQFSKSRFARAIGDTANGRTALKGLVRRGIIHRVPCKRGTVVVEDEHGVILAKWTIPSRTARIDLLVADAADVVARFPVFASRRPPSRAVCWAALEWDAIQVSPISRARDAISPIHHPAATLLPQTVRARFRQAEASLRTYIALSASRSGIRRRRAGSHEATGRLTLNWQTTTDPLHIVIAQQPIPPGAIPLACAVAVVEGGSPGYGIAAAPVVAEHVARYEAIERFACSQPECSPHPTVRPHRSVVQLPGLGFDFLRAIAPIRPTPPGLPHDEYHDVRVARDVRRRRVARTVPIEWIYLGCSDATNTSGAAYGRTRRDAILAGVCELSERDCFMRAWYGCIPSRELNERHLDDPGVQQWRAAARARKLDARWFLVGNVTGLSTVVCVLRSPKPPHVGVGAAARSELTAAAEKAFFEAAGSHARHLATIEERGIRRFRGRVRDRLAGDPAQHSLLEFEDYWAARRHGASEIAARFSRPKIAVTHVLDPRGFLYVDITPVGLTTGRVVKVFHPDAAPLPNNMAQLGMLERLLGVPEQRIPLPLG